MPAPRPAIRHGQPGITITWWRSFALALFGMSAPFLCPILVDVEHSTATRALLVIAKGIQLAALIFMVRLSLRWFRISAALKRVPPACFNCLYLVEAQPVCPECGCVQNYDDFSTSWKRWIRKHRR